METSLQKDPNFQALYDTDPEFRQLSEDHVKLKTEAADLSKAKYLSPDMMARLKEMKKRKLELKDKLLQKLHQERQ